MRHSDASEGRSPSIFASESIARGELDAVMAECDGLRRQLQAAADALAAKERQVEELQKGETEEIMTLKKLIDTRLEGKAQQTMYLNETTAKLHRRITECEDEIQTLTSQLDQATFAKNALDLEVQAMAVKLHGLEKENASLSDALKHQRGLTAQVTAELDALRSDLAVSQRRSRSEPADLQAAQHEYAMQVRQLSKALSELESTLRGACATAPPLSAGTVLAADGSQEAWTPATWSWDSSSVVMTIGAKGPAFSPGAPTALFITARDALSGQPVDMPPFATIACGGQRVPSDASSCELLAVGYGGLVVRAPRRVSGDTWSLEAVVDAGTAQSRVGLRLLTCTGALRASRTFPVESAYRQADARRSVSGSPHDHVGGRVGLRDAGEDTHDAGTDAEDVTLPMDAFNEELTEALVAQQQVQGALDAAACDLHFTPDPVPPGGVVHAVLSLRNRAGRVIQNLTQAAGWEWRVKACEGVVPRSITPGPVQKGAVAFSFAAAHDVGVASIAVEVLQTKDRGDMAPGAAAVVEGSVAVRASSTSSMLSDISMRLRGLTVGVNAIALRLSELERLVTDRTTLLTRTEKEVTHLRQSFEVRSAESRRDAEEAEQQGVQQQKLLATAQTEINKLTLQLSDMSEAKLVLHTTYEAVIAELQSVRLQLRDGDEALRAKDQEIGNLQAQLDVHRSKVTQLQDAHQQMLDTASSQNKQQLASKDERIASLDERITMIMQDTVQKSHAHASEVAAVKGELASAQRQLEEVAVRLAEREGQHGRLIEEHTAAVQRAEALAGQVASHEAQNEKLKREVAATVAARDTLQASLEQTTSAVAALEAQVQTTSAQGDTAVAELTREKDMFAKQREQWEEEAAIKAREIKSLAVQIATLSEDSGATNAALTLSEQKIVNVTEELAQLRTTHDTLFLEFKQKCGECDTLAATEAQLRQQLSDAQDSILRASEVHSHTVVELTNKLTTKETDLATIRLRCETVERELGTAAVVQEQATLLRQDLEVQERVRLAVTTECEEVKEEKAALEVKVRDMEAQLGVIKASLTATREGMVDIEKQKQTYEAALADVRAERDTLQGALASCEEELQVVTRAADAAAERAKVGADDLAENASQLREKEAAVEELTAQVTTMTEELVVLTDRCNTHHAAALELNEDLSRERSRAESIDAARSRFESELTHARDELAQFRATAADSVMEVETKYRELSEEHRTLRHEYRQLEEDSTRRLEVQQRRTAEEEEKARLVASEVSALKEELTSVRTSSAVQLQTAKSRYEELAVSRDELDATNARRWEAQERGYEKRVAALEQAVEEAEQRCEEVREEGERQAAMWQTQLRTLEDASQDDIARLQTLHVLAVEDSRTELEGIQTRLASTDAALHAERATTAALAKRASLAEQLLVITEETAERALLAVEAGDIECVLMRRALDEVRRSVRGLVAARDSEADEAAHVRTLNNEAQRQLETQRGERDELAVRLRSVEAAMASRTDELDASSRRCGELEATLAEARTAHALYTQRIQATHEEQLLDIQESAAALREKCSTADTDLQAVTQERSALRDSVASLEGELERRTAECAAAAERTSSLEAQLHAKAKEAAGLEERVLRMASERIGEAERFSSETVRIADELLATRCEGERVGGELDQARDALQRSKEEMRELQSRLASERNETARIEVELDASLEALRRMRAADMEQQAKTRALREEVSRLSADLDDKDREASRTGGALAVAERELAALAHLREENRMLAEEVAAFKGRADDMHAAGERADMQRRALEHQKATLADEVDALSKEVQALSEALAEAGRKGSFADAQQSLVESQLQKAQQGEVALRQAFALEKEHLEFEVARLAAELREERRLCSFISSQAEYARRALEGHGGLTVSPPRRQLSAGVGARGSISPSRASRPHIAALESEHYFVHRITRMEQEMLAAHLFHAHQLDLAHMRERLLSESLAAAEADVSARNMEIVRVKEELMLLRQDASNKDVFENARLQVTAEENRHLKDIVAKLEDEKRVLVAEQHKLISELDSLDVKHKILEAKATDADSVRRSERDARMQAAQLRAQVASLEEELAQVKRNLNDEIKMRIECQETLSSVRGGDDTDFSNLDLSKLSETEEKVRHLSRMNGTLREERRLDLQNIQQLRDELEESREFSQQAEQKMNLAKELVKDWEQSVNANHNKQLHSLRQEAYRSKTRVSEMDHQLKTASRRNESLQLELQIQRQRAHTAEVALKEAHTEIADLRGGSTRARASGGHTARSRSAAGRITTTPTSRGRSHVSTPASSAYMKSPSIATHYVSLAKEP